MYALKFNDQGIMLVDSLVLSSEAWFVGCAINKKDWTRGFEETQDSLREEAKSLLSGVVNAADLSHLTNHIRQTLGLDEFFADEPRKHRFRSAPIDPNKPEQEDDPLNSFLLSDLADTADALTRGETSEPLARYLSHHDTTQRLHLDKPEADMALIDRLAPLALCDRLLACRKASGVGALPTIGSQQSAPKPQQQYRHNGRQRPARYREDHPTPRPNRGGGDTTSRLIGLVEQGLGRLHPGWSRIRQRWQTRALCLSTQPSPDGYMATLREKAAETALLRREMSSLRTSANAHKKEAETLRGMFEGLTPQTKTSI
ncbi:hypothetical protein [Pseudomonas glycinae]|uniref:hypothetical protein n=1 Tax=Pseudomonas glycinae TaxID=1785145 RepID=UPI001F1B619F|nr:hypothetical protein [Pseudomonas glycinae]